MVGGLHRRVALALLIAGLVAGGLGLISRGLGGLSWLEQRSIDARFTLRGHAQPSSRVVIVALDTASYRRLPLPPLPRRLDAQVIERLADAGARAIAFDFALERPSSDANADFALARSLARAGRAVVSVTAVSPGGVTDPLVGRVPFAGAVRPGVTLLPLDGDGTIRRFPAALGGIQSFALVAAQLEASNVAAQPPSRALIDYPGPTGTVPEISFVDALAGRFDPASVRGKVVVIGPTAPVLQDIHRTPVAAAMSGTEIQADAVATALDGFPLRLAPAAVTTLALLALGLLVPLIAIAVMRMRQRHADSPVAALDRPALDAFAVAGIGIGAAVLWSVIAQVAFDRGTVLDYTDGLLSIAIAAAAAWGLASFLERRERQRLRTLFAGYAPDVVEQVLREPRGRGGTLTASTVIAGYRIEELIGRGGMGVVYRASQLHLDRPVALKLIRPEYAQSTVSRARFERESRLAAAVAHPNVVPVLDAGDDNGLLYIAMQYIDGINLAQMLDGLGALEASHGAHLVGQIAAALDAAHRHQLVHRDVKPANILLPVDEPDHGFLTDFGLAKLVAGQTQLTQADTWAGTIDYLAPEQIDGGQVDHRTDVYALSCVLFHCLTGRVPFPRENPQATMWAQLNAPRPAATALRPDLPDAIDGVIARGMATTPGMRYPSAGEFAAQAGAALGVPVRAAPRAEAEPRELFSGPFEDGPTQVSG